MTTSTVSSSRPDLIRGVPHSASEVRAATRRLGLVPSRSLGQSFLVDSFIADAEAALAAPRPGEAVVEIGGGLGLLTEALLRRGVESLTVVERDRRLATHLRSTFGRRITVVEGDALTADLPRAEVVVGNLPFSAGTPILQRLWAIGVPRVIVLLQREVVERICATHGSKRYGRLTLQAALYGIPEPFQVVPSTAFEPQPEVEGQILKFDHRPGPLPVPSVERFEWAVRLLFSSRRKQLGNLLPRVVAPAQRPDDLARRAGWPDGWERLRPEDIPVEGYVQLARALAGEG